MEIVTVDKINIAKEHICCAISKNDDCQVTSKKDWLLKEFDDGLVFKKCDVRGKCFIEYIPAENAWAPIIADNYMYIDCLWVSGQFKGHGNSNLLFNECVNDSKQKGKSGLVVLSSDKKRGFLSDPGYLKYKGFTVADKCDPYFTLMYLPFENNADKPKFRQCVKSPSLSGDGFVLYYANQCPFTAKYVPIIENIASESGIKLEAIKFDDKISAQNSPSPFTSYSLFYNKKFVTHEILSENKFKKIIDELCIK